MPKVYKIGLTTNSVKKRINELNTTGIPKSFRAEKVFQIEEKYLKQVEKLAHKNLKNKDLHHGKEFFEGSLLDCVESVQDAIFEITNEHESDLIGEARERAAAAKQRRDDERRILEEKQARLDLVNLEIDRQRSEYVKNLRKDKPLLDKYFYEPLGFLLLGVLVMAIIYSTLGPIGWIVGPIALYFFYKHCKDSDELKLIEAAKIKFPYKSLDNFEICEFQLKGSKNSEQKKLQTTVGATNISRDFPAEIHKIGVINAQGRKDDTQVAYLYHKAAEQGVADAQYNLGIMYYQGKGVPKNDVQAEYWYRKAAEQGHADAQFSLGVMNALGRKDDTQAVYWYRQAAEQGFVDAQFNLGIMYYKGRGVIKDDGQAAYWYRKAAEQGHVLAQAKLGVSYSQGR
uniref:Putative Beta-lactamase n=1 Tax=Candidatus Nitrotoga fabula TaxID=2182327 RepID=A0A2X0RC11_9PROT|nr:putative Beta-lactamase [Candidatus Nitrotoga fabula]